MGPYNMQEQTVTKPCKQNINYNITNGRKYDLFNEAKLGTLVIS